MTREDGSSILPLGTKFRVGCSGRAPVVGCTHRQDVDGESPSPRANSVGGDCCLSASLPPHQPSLYVVVRGDLPPGLQMAQACHAVREWEHAFLHAVTNGNLIVLSVPGLPELAALKERGDGQTAVVPFYEPDIGGELTAIALVGGRAKPLLRKLPLALADR